MAGRRAYIDWARGLAVLLMIEAHAVDAWTRPSARASAAYRNAIILGGFAAPLFLWLAGVALALAGASAVRRSGSRRAATAAVVKRGLELFILAFAFRLQSFIVTPGGSPVTIFRVDILNIMGPSIAAAACIWGLTASTRSRVMVFSMLAAAFAMLTPPIRGLAAIGRLPLWMQWYIRPAGDMTTFTAFPWAGFVFAGVVVGVVIAAADDRQERFAHAAFAAAGAGLIVVGAFTATLPTIYESASFWTSSPTFFAIRVGVLMLALSGLYAIGAGLGARTSVLGPLARFGRHSLFVYWIHVELVYGYATWLIHNRLPVWGTFVALSAFLTLMYGAVLLRDRIAEWWRRRRGQRGSEGNGVFIRELGGAT